ncbi:hypothetical protein AC579_2054 [Pseudocercospora musae]|uniref:Uncharacterized protein n=1 Tax=Pseudocercospora musae TaxID=113226 RepID=A0A139IBX9_9PEZI|nr:hypothetical protein AC579_2054 [Pseudocercospora musae]
MHFMRLSKDTTTAVSLEPGPRQRQSSQATPTSHPSIARAIIVSCCSTKVGTGWRNQIYVQRLKYTSA